ncbi:hypothetical protein [uncultured Croceicoccus sp.]|nr:hypothetical protein [uncultured Croceicoccus sp.]
MTKGVAGQWFRGAFLMGFILVSSEILYSRRGLRIWCAEQIEEGMIA